MSGRIGIRKRCLLLWVPLCLALPSGVRVSDAARHEAQSGDSGLYESKSGYDSVRRKTGPEQNIPEQNIPELETGRDPAWLELPAMEQREGVSWVVHYSMMDTLRVRNFSMWYDTGEKIAYWVAYPLHPSYFPGSGRSDAWGYDPQVHTSLQVNLKSAVRGYDRGHQIPSGDRTCDAAMNAQTFYYTNMTPQNPTLNRGFWARLEAQVRKWAEGCDTLYVVTGAALRTLGGGEEVSYAQNKAGVAVAVPNYYYKALLSLKDNKYKAIGFWIPNQGLTGRDFFAYAKTVREIEALTGFNFFANLSGGWQDAVETAYLQSDWPL